VAPACLIDCNSFALIAQLPASFGSHKAQEVRLEYEGTVHELLHDRIVHPSSFPPLCLTTRDLVLVTFDLAVSDF
jgi:hypothetical protein